MEISSELCPRGITRLRLVSLFPCFVVSLFHCFIVYFLALFISRRVRNELRNELRNEEHIGMFYSIIPVLKYYATFFSLLNLYTICIQFIIGIPTIQFNSIKKRALPKRRPLSRFQLYTNLSIQNKK